MSVNIIFKEDIPLQGFSSELQNLLSTAKALGSSPSTENKQRTMIINEYAEFFTNLDIINIF